MSLPHFFLREQVLAFESAPVFALHLDADDTKHAKVLRLAVGEHIAVVDAVSDYFECEIVSFEGDELSVSIAQKLSSYARLRLFLFRVWPRARRWTLLLGMQPKLVSRSLSL